MTRVRQALLASVLLVLLVLAWLAQPNPTADPTSTVPVSGPQDPPDPPPDPTPMVADVGEVTPPAEECPNDTNLSQWIDHCTSELIANDCPAPFRAIDDTQRTRQLVDEACGSDFEYTVECATWPCMVSVRGPVPDCLDELLPVTDTVHSALQPVAYGLEADSWLAQILGSSIRRREPQRLRRLERLTDQGSIGSTSVQRLAGCSAATFDPMEPRCDLLTDAIACQADELQKTTPEEVDRYLDDVDDMLARHANHCPGFAASEWSIDCSDLPCVLVLVDEPADDMPVSIGCGEAWTSATWVTVHTNKGPVTTVPLYLPSIPAVATQRFERDPTGRRSKAILGTSNGTLPWRDQHTP